MLSILDGSEFKNFISLFMVISLILGITAAVNLTGKQNDIQKVSAAYSPKIVPTFESAGIYIDSAGCTGTLGVEFRALGSSQWKDGHPLQCKADQYRGSLVRLDPGTTYEIRFAGESTIHTTTTWEDQFPIGKVTELPSITSDCTNNANLYLSSSDSGTADGYHLYRPSGSNAVLDGQDSCEYNIFVADNTHHIIIQGLELTNAASDAVMLSDGDQDDPDDGAHDIVIDGNDIHSWGGSGLGGGEDHGAIATEFTCRDCLGGVKRIIIQNNNIHEPNGNSNDWDSGHPQGPRAVHLVSPQGQIVIRNNHMWSTDEHRYNDVIGGRKNDGPIGSVGRDSDIYDNIVSHCWDDGIEVEGDNTNVRVYDNQVSHCYIGIAFASTVYGPLYVFNNLIVDNARTGTDTNPDDTKAYGFKMGNSGAECHSNDQAYGMKCGDGYGYIYLYHNTVAADNFNYAPENGASDSGGPVKYLNSKNNIFNGTNDCIDAPDASNSSTNDVCNGNFDIGQIDDPMFGEAIFQSGTHIPDDNSIAKDTGILITGFNDDFLGTAPDAGWKESGGTTPSASPSPEPTATSTDSIPGDANDDQKVDGVDFTIWLINYNQNTSNGSSDGDFNGDEKVDGIDFTIWLNNYGTEV